MKITLWCLLSLVFNSESILAAKILGIIPTPSYSHQTAFRPLWKELSLRGHQVTVITTDPMNNSDLVNLTEINISSVYDFWPDINMFEVNQTPLWKIMFKYFDLSAPLLEKILLHPKIQNLIHDKKIQFELVMVEAFPTAAYAFVPHFKCPLIILSSLDGSSFAYSEVGNPSHPILNPDFMLPFKTNLLFFERLASWGNDLFLKFYYSTIYIPNQQILIRKYFGDGYPRIQEIYKNYSIFFVNTNILIHSIRPLLPNIIQIGGAMHLMNSNPLPDKLQKTLDSAKNGFIYFSLGTNVKSKHLSNKTKQEILDAFKELPHTILWKFEDESLVNIPKNVIISKWFPQQDVLRHPNIKLFITQGGLQSLEESIYNYVPIIGIPVISDQMGNIASVVSKGIGLSLDFKSIKKDTLKSTILEVINNPRYTAKMREISKYSRDQPDTGLARAIWWTEYVIRHKGAGHLRNPGLNLPSYQYYLLDIYAFLIFCILITYFVLRTCFKIFRKMYYCVKQILNRKEKQS